MVGIIAEGDVWRFRRASVDEFDVAFGACELDDLVIAADANGGNGGRNVYCIFKSEDAETASCVWSDGLVFGKVAPSKETESRISADRSDITKDSRGHSE